MPGDVEVPDELVMVSFAVKMPTVSYTCEVVAPEPAGLPSPKSQE